MCRYRDNCMICCTGFILCIKDYLSIPMQQFCLIKDLVFYNSVESIPAL